MDKTGDVEPLEAPQDRFEPDPMLIGGPHFDVGLREGLLEFTYLLREFFLNASWASGSALAWRERSRRLL